MDCYERMNAAIRYIEENLGGEIDYAQIARIACCPAHQFQRLFAFMADIPLSDYIRRRKLTQAAQDLRQSTTRILDIALKLRLRFPCVL